MRQETIDRIRKFTADRNWGQFHTPANLAKSIAIEAGELLECYQWSEEADLEQVKQELADVIVYCRNMLDALGLDEDEIINAKMDQNEKKYPVDKAYGNSKKYTDYKTIRQICIRIRSAGYTILRLSMPSYRMKVLLNGFTVQLFSLFVQFRPAQGDVWF